VFDRCKRDRLERLLAEIEIVNYRNSTSSKYLFRLCKDVIFFIATSVTAVAVNVSVIGS
jgi:hypothetical protein